MNYVNGFAIVKGILHCSFTKFCFKMLLSTACASIFLLYHVLYSLQQVFLSSVLCFYFYVFVCSNTSKKHVQFLESLLEMTVELDEIVFPTETQIAIRPA